MHYGTITFQKNFKIILINNGGGNFQNPGQRNSCFNTFFETSHCLTAEHLAKCMDLIIASDEQSLSKGLATLYAQNEKPGLLKSLPQP
jgi:2-succinyl-5-enolpyruvyl-6-hydroxy-3-cyclohexene-1-carboxylate synthase